MAKINSKSKGKRGELDLVHSLLIAKLFEYESE